MAAVILVCPYVPRKLRAETIAAISRYAEGHILVSFVELDPTDHYAYGRLLAGLWRTGESFAIVEQDIVIRRDVVSAFLNCRCEYGGFPYQLGTGIAVALGCTRFRGRFTFRYPDAVEQAVASGRAWNQLDVTLQHDVLRDLHGHEPHICGGEVEHLNEQKRLRPDGDPLPTALLPQGGPR